MMLEIKLDDPICEPHLGSTSAAGFDLKAKLKESILLRSDKTTKIDTGIQVAIPKGYCGIIVPRSGLGTKYNLKLANTAGIIDSDYRGNIFVNVSVEKNYYLQPYERFAQMVIVPVLTDYTIVKELDETERGDSGFGDSGTH